MSSRVAYLPVPTNSRLRKVCEPIVSGSGLDRDRGAAADEGDDFQDIAVGERRLVVPPSGHEVAVDLDRDVFWLNPEVPQKSAPRSRVRATHDARRSR